jgi:cysteine desulfurase
MNERYCDYAATTPLDKKVMRAMQPYFTQEYANPNALHYAGQKSSAAILHARRTIADAVYADFENIIFTGSATEANNLALQGIATEKKGTVLISAIEHESVRQTARTLTTQGMTVKEIPVTRAGIIDLNALKKTLNDKVILISCMYVNNEIGTIQPIKKITTLIEEQRKRQGTRYPYFHTDAVQALQYLDCNIEKLGVDMMTLSAHKLYGPKGVGALYVKKDIQEHLTPIIHGGGQERGLRAGTENTPAIVGFGKAVEISEKMKKKETVRMKALQNHFLKKLKTTLPKCHINGSLTNRIPNNINIYVPNFPASQLLVHLDLQGVRASSGSACTARIPESSYVIEALGYSKKRSEQSVRFTLGRFTERQNCDAVVTILKKIVHNKRSGT